MEKLIELLVSSLKILPLAASFLFSLALNILTYPYIGPLSENEILVNVFLVMIVVLVSYYGHQKYSDQYKTWFTFRKKKK